MSDSGIIHELSQETIDKIAAGEVVERPASVVKELVENAIDAGATAITVEIRDGGTSLIRVTDNGVGIASSDVRKAFLRHATSKISSADDLMHIHSLGFRGEALSSIAAVSKVEMVTKKSDEITAAHYIIEGSIEDTFEEIGAPEGTTIFVRNLFFNTPARKKFLKSPVTEGNSVTEIVERLALSNPGVSFRYLMGQTEKLVTAGNGRLYDTIYEIYGKQIAKSLLPVKYQNDVFSISGFIGKPVIVRGNRAFEAFFVGGRYVKSKILQRALEEGYKGYLMQRMYPFCVLGLDFADESYDVNVHPTKQDVRFFDEKKVFDSLCQEVSRLLSEIEDISDALPKKEDRPATVVSGAEPFESGRLMEIKEQITKSIREDSPYSRQYEDVFIRTDTAPVVPAVSEEVISFNEKQESEQKIEQLSFLSEEARRKHRIVGEVFDVYWIVEYDDSMYIIDQHAAHEKVLYERFMKQLKDKEMTSQMISPPQIVTLSFVEEEALRRYKSVLEELGFKVSHFGGREYALDAVPANLYGIDSGKLFVEVMNMLSEKNKIDTDELVMEKVASMSCKAAVKGHDHLSFAEADALIDELLTLDNPYHCPHGRPTIISMSRYELDKRFRRIV